jgi:hypothetical protein
LSRLSEPESHPLSPDLSPIEHLWDELGRRVRHRKNPPETLQELRDALVHEWNNIPHAFIQRLIGSMRRENKSWTDRNCHAVWSFAEFSNMCDHLLQQRQIRISDA